MLNITYKDRPFPTIYTQVPAAQAIELASTKEDVRMFHFLHNPTRIAMVTLVEGKLVTGQYNK